MQIDRLDMGKINAILNPSGWKLSAIYRDAELAAWICLVIKYDGLQPKEGPGISIPLPPVDITALSVADQAEIQQHVAKTRSNMLTKFISAYKYGDDTLLVINGTPTVSVGMARQTYADKRRMLNNFRICLVCPAFNPKTEKCSVSETDVAHHVGDKCPADKW